MLDVLIRGGLVYDGNEVQPKQTDIGIQGERIVSVGDLSKATADHVIDAMGKVVLPGMIDVHTHVDLEVLTRPTRHEAIMQGITTEITGACGIGLFPLTNETGQYLPTIRAIVGDHPRAFASCTAYLEALPATATNVAVQVSHSPLRMEVAGCMDKALDHHEMKQLKQLTARAFEEGACGISTGLAYYPAAFGDTQEVVELCKVAASYDAVMSVHQRTAFRQANPIFDSREEVLDFARLSGARLQYSHYRTTPNTAGEVETLLEPIQRGLAEGLLITADFYPYPIGAGYAAVVLPMWVMDGGFEATIEKLKNPRIRGRILADIKANNSLLLKGVVTHMPQNREYVGLSYGQIAGKRGQKVAEMLLDLLAEAGLNMGYRLELGFDSDLLLKQEKDFVNLLSQPFYMLGSDTLPAQNKLHPRSYGAFAKMLRLAVKYGLPLETFANRSARLPATVFGLKDRGIIARGAYADLCVFVPENVTENSTFENPARLASGMETVIVNGRLAVQDSTPTGILAGKALRRCQ